MDSMRFLHSIISSIQSGIQRFFFDSVSRISFVHWMSNCRTARKCSVVSEFDVCQCQELFSSDTISQIHDAISSDSAVLHSQVNHNQMNTRNSISSANCESIPRDAGNCAVNVISNRFGRRKKCKQLVHNLTFCFIFSIRFSTDIRCPALALRFHSTNGLFHPQRTFSRSISLSVGQSKKRTDPEPQNELIKNKGGGKRKFTVGYNNKKIHKTKVMGTANVWRNMTVAEFAKALNIDLGKLRKTSDLSHWVQIDQKLMIIIDYRTRPGGNASCKRCQQYWAQCTHRRLFHLEWYRQKVWIRCEINSGAKFWITAWIGKRNNIIVSHSRTNLILLFLLFRIRIEMCIHDHRHRRNFWNHGHRLSQWWAMWIMVKQHFWIRCVARQWQKAKPVALRSTLAHSPSHWTMANGWHFWIRPVMLHSVRCEREVLIVRISLCWSLPPKMV